MQPAKTFRDLIVWQKAYRFILEVYRSTESFPKSELYGITSQIRRASVSIAANIAEGFKRKGKQDKLRFYNIAEGSIEEVKFFLMLSKDLNLLNDDSLFEKLEEVSKLLNGYSQTISKGSN